MTRFIVSLALLYCLLVGCSTVDPPPNTVGEPESPVHALCESGQYHAAMRALPRAMKQWAAYTERTGRTCEGAAGYEYSTTMFVIAAKGDADWGTILDDPQIPYAYKTEVVFEILEARLGKGAVYVGNKKYFLVPRLGVVDLDTERIKLPEEGSEPGDALERLQPAASRPASAAK